MSFYFPYDFCLYRKMSPLISYFLRFLPLIMALLVVPITYRIRYVVLEYNIYDSQSFLNLNTNWSFPCFTQTFRWQNKVLSKQQFDFFHFRQANKSKGKLKHHGVWTIVLLIYTHTVHTCMSVLNCPKIIDNNGRSISVSVNLLLKLF